MSFLDSVKADFSKAEAVLHSAEVDLTSHFESFASQLGGLAMNAAKAGESSFVAVLPTLETSAQMVALENFAKSQLVSIGAQVEVISTTVEGQVVSALRVTFANVASLVTSKAEAEATVVVSDVTTDAAKLVPEVLADVSKEVPSVVIDATKV